MNNKALYPNPNPIPVGEGAGSQVTLLHELIRLPSRKYAFEAASAIARHMGWPLSAVIEDATAERYKHFNFAKHAETKKR